MWTEHVAPDSLRTCWRVRPSQHSSFVRVFEQRRPNQTVRRANISVPRWVAWSWDEKETHPWPGWQQKWVKRFIMPCDQHDTVFMAKRQIPPKNGRLHIMFLLLKHFKLWMREKHDETIGGPNVCIHFYSSWNKQKKYPRKSGNGINIHRRAYLWVEPYVCRCWERHWASVDLLACQIRC